MAEVVAVFSASHTPLLLLRAKEAPEDVQKRMYASFKRMGDTMVERGAEALVVFINDHLHALFLDRHPSLAVGVSSKFHTVTSEAYLPEVEGGRPGDEDFGMYLVTQLLERHFDLARCHEVGLDHSLVVPLHLMGDPPIPIVPIFQNTVAPPLSPASRSYDLGVAVRRALDDYKKVDRVAILGTGAPSHWIGTPGMGRIDQEWDKAVIGLLQEGAADRLSQWSQPEIDAGGNGANEIRNWIASAAVAGNTKAELQLYEPEPCWFVGVTVLEWPVGPAI